MWTAALLGAVACLCAPAGAAPADPELARWRAERRAAVRAADKAAFEFGLLVIPVDFADARLAAGWDAGAELAPRVAGLDGETLERYFTTASGREGWLRIVLAPPVHLPETRVYYSDLQTPFTHARARALAAGALAGADTAGVPFAAADADDDGHVDGVLILHAAPGLENDPDTGRVVPMQYYLEAPHLQAGTSAQCFAVASLHSGPGVWAHESAHLLGLEDRYDPDLSPAGDGALSRGGLGNFSLMSAGAWGQGDGSGASLLDAYSAAQLGWAPVTELARGDSGAVTLGPGALLRLPASRTDPGEYFLLEVRGGDGAWPFDALFPDPRLLVYHVDESVPDFTHATDAPDRLRVRLVEADGDTGLADGDSQGGLDDMFPGEAGPFTWDAGSLPASDGYHGTSGVACVFAQAGDSVTVVYDIDGTGFDLSLSVAIAGGDTLLSLDVTGPDQGDAALSVQVTHLFGISDWGAFAGDANQVSRDLLPAEEGRWVLDTPLVWVPHDTPPAGATSIFAVELRRDDVAFDLLERTWLWRALDDPLDFAAAWPGDWQFVSPDPAGTGWHRWPAGAAEGLPDAPVLACTGDAHADGSAWPEVRYSVGGDARLLSPPLATDGGVLRLIHALDVPAWEPGLGYAGAQVDVRLHDGGYVPLEPLGGYGGAIAGDSGNPLHGQPAFVDPGEPLDGAAPLWRVDLFPLPEDAHGWTRLGLHLANDLLALRGRGWLVARLDLVDPATATAPFAAVWDADRDGLALSWPWEPPEWITVEASLDDGAAWTTVWESAGPSGHSPADMLVPASLMSLPAGAQDQRTLLRARVRIDVGEVVSRTGRLGSAPQIASLDLGTPTPNPFAAETRFLAEHDLLGAELGVYDLRGRRVRAWWLPHGAFLLGWDGRDDAGRMLPAGVYVIRLAAWDGSRTASRKVTLIR